MFKTEKKKLRRNIVISTKRTSNLKCNAENSGNVNLQLFNLNYTLFFTSKNTTVKCNVQYSFSTNIVGGVDR